VIGWIRRWWIPLRPFLLTSIRINKGQSRRAGTVLVRDAWSRSYQVTPSGGSAPNRMQSTNLEIAGTPNNSGR
jgi:hypothetical protein